MKMDLSIDGWGLDPSLLPVFHLFVEEAKAFEMSGPFGRIISSLTLFIGKSISLRIELDSPLRGHACTSHRLFFQPDIPIPEANRSSVRRALRDAIVGILLHEFDEWVEFNGELAFNPHAQVSP